MSWHPDWSCSGLMIAAKPPDAEHPYGHGRLETLSALAVGMMLVDYRVLIAFGSHAASRDAQPAPAAYAVWPLIASIAIKAVMSASKRHYGRKIRSSGLMADAWNDTVDVLSGTTALLGLGLTLLDPEKFAAADRIGGAAVGVIVIFLGIRVVRDTTLQLMDTMPDPEAMDRIRKAGAHRPRRARHREMFRAQDRSEMARGSAPGSGSRHERIRIARNRHAGARQIRTEVDWVADVLVHVEPHMLGTISVGPHGKS